jgi:hypothetical protein
MNEAALGGFGDKRREDLGAALLDAVESKRTLCIHRLAEDRNQTIRFNNFLSNPAVSTHEMLVTGAQDQPACRRTACPGDHGHDRCVVSLPKGQQTGVRFGQRRRASRPVPSSCSRGRRTCSRVVTVCVVNNR